MTEKKPVIFAFTGKGGVGKTSLSAQCVRLLSENFPDKKVLAIDADPAIGLATALGVEVGSTVDDIRKMFVETAEEGDKKASGMEMRRFAESSSVRSNHCAEAVTAAF